MRQKYPNARATLVLCLLVAMAVIAGCGQKGIAKLDKEPEITVVVNTETGEQKTMPIEQYVAGVVGGEMGQLPAAGGNGGSWPENAYAAQAILARSFTMQFITQHEGEAISTDVEEAQAYKPENITPVIEAAVQKTRGEVIVYKGDYVKTWFHSYSGGRTATAAEGLNFKDPAPYTKSVRLPDNEFVPADKKQWTATFTTAEIAQSLQAKGVNVGDISEIKVSERGPSGRATQVRIDGTQGNQTMHAADFRIAVGAEKMLSTLLDDAGIQVQGDQVTMAGTGFGHGVGLSQWDAYKLAKDGKTPEQIITMFFQGTRVEKVWD